MSALSAKNLKAILDEAREQCAAAFFCGSSQRPHLFVEFMPGMYLCQICHKAEVRESPDSEPSDPSPA